MMVISPQRHRKPLPPSPSLKSRCDRTLERHNSPRGEAAGNFRAGRTFFNFKKYVQSRRCARLLMMMTMQNDARFRASCAWALLHFSRIFWQERGLWSTTPRKVEFSAMITKNENLSTTTSRNSSCVQVPYFFLFHPLI